MYQKILLCFIAVLLFSFSDLQAQRYGTSVGLRMGNTNLSRTIGISAQQRLLENITLEGIVQSDFNTNTTLHLLLEKHRPILSKRFNYYYGAGLSVGQEESFVKNRQSKEITQTYGNVTSGVDLIAGFEMTMFNTTFSVDYKPNINITGREEFFRGQVGISARMVLVKSREQNKNRRQKARARKKKNGSSFLENLKSKFQRPESSR